MKQVSAFFLGFALFVLILPSAEGITVKSYVDKNVVPLNDKLLFKVEIAGTGVHRVPDPDLQSVPGFTIAGRSTSSNFYIVNPEISISNVYTYTLIPEEKGSFTLPAVSVVIDNRTYSSQPIRVEVTDPVQTAPPQVPNPGGRSLFDQLDDLFNHPESLFPRERRKIAKEDLFVRMEVDKKQVVVNEQVILTFSFYRAIPIWGNPTFLPPALTGFWTEDIPLKGSQKDFVQVVNGRRYNVSVVKSALFPVSAGRILIDSARLQVQIDPFPDSVELQTEPILLEVLELPQRGKPVDFGGLVGRYSMDLEVDKTRTASDQPISVTVTVAGTGNVKAVPNPLRTELDSFDSFEPEVSDSVEKTAQGLSGFKKFKYVLIPRKEGTLEIPRFQLSFFDPEAGRYETLTTRPIRVEVTPGAEGDRAVPSSSAKRQFIQRLRSDILFIKPDRVYLEDEGEPIYRNPIFYLLLAAPVLLLGGTIFVRRWRHRLSTDVGYARGQRAARRARQRLSEAKGSIHGGKPEEFYASVDSALRGYFADKWNLPAPSLTNETIEGRLAGTNGTLTEDLIGLLENCAYARFAPTGHTENDMMESFKKASDLIVRLDKMDW
jgi:hypothetical protein